MSLVTPHSTDTERALLSCVLNSPEAVLTGLMGDYASPRDLFFDERIKAVYIAAEEMQREGLSIDVLTVLPRMEAMTDIKVDRAELIDLWTLSDSPLNWDTHASLLLELKIRRELILHSFQVKQAAEDQTTSLGDAMDVAHQGAIRVSEAFTSKDRSVDDFLRESVADLEEAFNRKGKMIGYPTGFRKLDKTTRGFRKGQLIIVAARPGMGKTSLAMTMAVNGAGEGVKAAFFSLEMLGKDIVTRATCGMAGVPMWRAESGDLDQKDLAKLAMAQKRFRSLPIHIIESSGITMPQLYAKTSQLVASKGINVVYVDYLQLIKGAAGKGRYEMVTEISNELKSMALKLKVTVIALAQLNREAEGQMPSIAHLRDSGSIEQDADIVMLLHLLNEDRKHDAEQEIDLLIAKHRNGAIGKMPLIFNKPTTTFTEPPIEDDVFRV